MDIEVGVRLHTLRIMYGWSQRELAKRAGVTNSAISMIEQGRVSPSVSSLKKVLDGIPMSLADFFNLDLGGVYPAFFKADDFVSQQLNEGVTSRMLPKTDSRPLLACQYVVYSPGAESGREMSSSCEEQQGFIVAGELEVRLAGRVEVLGLGSGFHIKPFLPHRFRNVSVEEARLVIISFQPS